MGIGSLLFGFIGAFVRWIFGGCRKKFIDIYKPERVHKEGIDVATSEMINVWIGFITLMLLLFILHYKLNLFE